MENEIKEATLRKIQKLYALAGNNGNEAEVQAAMLKAQEMLLKHGLDMETVNGYHEKEKVEDTVKEDYPNQGGGKMYEWQRRITWLVAKNFRCKFFSDYTESRQTKMMLFGLSRDVDAAKETLEFIFVVAPKLWKSFYSTWQETPGNITWNKKQTYALKNDYFDGFVKGLNDKFVEQVQTKELMIVVPEAVIIAYRQRSTGFVHIKRKIGTRSNNEGAFNQGYQDGKGSEKHKYIS